MTASLRLKNAHWPIRVDVTSPARCSVARCAETVDCDSPQRASIRPAQTPWSYGSVWSGKCASGSRSHARISRRTGLDSALRIASMSRWGGMNGVGQAMWIVDWRSLYRNIAIYRKTRFAMGGLPNIQARHVVSSTRKSCRNIVNCLSASFAGHTGFFLEFGKGTLSRPTLRQP